MKAFISEKVFPVILRFINTKSITALKDGLTFAMPLMITGSVFLLIANFPIEAVVSFLTDTGLSPILNQAYESTFNIMAMIAVIGIAYTYTHNEGYAALPAGVIALSSFILLQPGSVTAETGESVSVLLKTWSAGQGMICAIVIGLVVGYVYSWFIRKGITIKMPKGVPSGVTNSFNALIPAVVITLGSCILYALFKIGFDTTFFEWIYTTIQTPLQGLTDSLGGIVIVAFIIPLLWWFGVHGASIVTGVMTGLWTANTAANQAILDAGNQLTLSNGAHIVTQQFYDQFICLTGSGITIGIVVYLIFRAKSEQYKKLGKISIFPAIFNINEPVLFGTPIVLNPILALPFIAVPVLTAIIEYFAIYSGLCPLYAGIMAPWTTPPIISGFIIGGWRTALLQAVIITMSVLIYYPFIKKIDEMAFKQERKGQE